jgi:NADH-quinone oxidoreductase subunit M
MADFLHLLATNSITRVVFFPALASLPLLVLRPQAKRSIKAYGLVVSLVELLLAIGLIATRFQAGTGLLGLRDLSSNGEPITWIARYGIHFDLGIDGVSMPLVLLTALLLPIVLLGSWRGIDKHWKGFTFSLLLLTTGVLGALTALDLFLFYVFWEVMLIPMYLLIGIWGGEQRVYAAVKFFLFTMAGSLLMLVAILWLAITFHDTTGVWSFSYEAFLQLELPLSQQLWLFGAFALAFAIKVPVFPLHTWLPDAHVQAPTGGSVILAGILLKLGTYGFLRFALPLFPHASHQMAPLVITLAIIGILYGALVSWSQDDMKKLVAYSSVAHLGFVMLGIAAVDLIAWQGSVIQMVNHGISTGALFLLVGMLYDRRHTKKFEDFGGLAKVMPWFAFFLVFSTLASVGLPALNGFVGEFLILLGSYRAGLVWPVILATFGVVLAAVYLLKMLYRTLWGPITREENRTLADLSLREILLMAPLCLLMLAIGVAPQPFLAPSKPDLEQVLASYEQALESPPPQSARVRTPTPPHQIAQRTVPEETAR